ncbi:MAG: phage terminase large subunit [Alphaproteobacteria bacterium]
MRSDANNDSTPTANPEGRPTPGGDLALDGDLVVDQDEFDAVCREDLAAYIEKTVSIVDPGAVYQHSWCIDAMAWHLYEAYRGNIKRLLITIPPRHLKSISVSVAFVSWGLGKDPTQRFIVASYASKLSDKFARMTHQLVNTPFYRRLFPKMILSRRKNSPDEFETTLSGGRFATSVGGTLTGYGVHYFIVDDPHNASEVGSEARRRTVIDWFTNAVPSRLESKRDGVKIVIMQRLHEDDLAGHLIEEGGWTHLNLPAIAEHDEDIPIGPGIVHHRRAGDLLNPNRESREDLEQTKKEMGSRAFSAQYQQNPVPAEGNMVKRAWLQRYDKAPEATPPSRVVQSWDTASSANGDYSVCTTWLDVGGKAYYLLHVYRDRIDYPTLKKRVIGLAKQYDAKAILIEKAGVGQGLIQELRSATRLSVIAIRPEGDKAARLEIASAGIEAGRVYLPNEAHWLADLEKELLGFPMGKHDDQVDSISQFLIWAQRHRPKVFGRGYRPVQIFVGNSESDFYGSGY